MKALEAVDSVEFVALADNVTDSLSSLPPFVATEFAGLTRRRKNGWVLGVSGLCCAAHGLSCLITVRKGSETRTAAVR
jgi:7,8-dihydropterin-6-yl-methyl-4-(beta-D-ribofuranosyl)aminobenzene 5'-phosphate synthase